MWVVRSHLLRYIRDKYGEDYTNLGTYRNLLVSVSKKEKPIQSAVFEKDELFRFIAEATSDGETLRDKVVALVS